LDSRAGALWRHRCLDQYVPNWADSVTADGVYRPIRPSL